MARVPGVSGYAEEAPVLLRSYEREPFEQVHSQVLHLLPSLPARVLDIGAGTGRDAAAFALRGYEVVAVEPVREMREGAMALHPEPGIVWIDDGLPELSGLAAQKACFDLVFMSAVFMHLDQEERAKSLETIAGLLKPGARLMMSLRHGPVPPGRTMFAVTAGEVAAMAGPYGFEVLFEAGRASLDPLRSDVGWTHLVLGMAGV